MSEIYKICYIVDNKIEKIYVFFGHRHLTDGRHKIEPKDLFKKEPENPVFAHIFSEDEMKNISENSIDVIFSDEMLHLDDTVETVKRKIIKVLDEEFSFDEIYFFCKANRKIKFS